MSNITEAATSASRSSRHRLLVVLPRLAGSFKRKTERETKKGDNKMKRRPDIGGQVVAGVLSRPVITVQIVLFSLSIVNKSPLP